MSRIKTAKKIIITTGCAVLFCGMTLPAHAEPIAFPAKGQTPEQQTKDQQECRQWAVQQTGVDPAKLPAPAATPSQEKDRQVLRSAAAGAAIGGLGGSMGGEFGKGAGAGAAAGAVVGIVKKRRARKEAEANQQQARQQQQQTVDQFDRAYGACLEGKGYTVK